MSSSKVMTAKQAVSQFIQDGITVFVGGGFYSISYAITHEIIRRNKKSLTICKSIFNEYTDNFIGTGSVDRIIHSYVQN